MRYWHGLIDGAAVGLALYFLFKTVYDHNIDGLLIWPSVIVYLGIRITWLD